MQVQGGGATHLSLQGSHLRSSLLSRIKAVVSRVVAGVPLGTTRGRCARLGMLRSGRLRLSRGAGIPGLAALGLVDDAVRRCGAALAYGQGHTAPLLEAWAHGVREEALLQGHQSGGSRPVAGALVGCVRPRLQAFSLARWPVAGRPCTALPRGERRASSSWPQRAVSGCPHWHGWQGPS